MNRHPLTLLTREVRPLSLRPGATLLLLQDLHAPFADIDDGALAQMARDKVVGREFDEYTDALRLIGPNVELVVAAARDHGLGVVYSCLGHERDQEPSSFQRATGWLWPLDGVETVFPAAWRPAPGDPVFAKPGWGALA